MILQLSVFGVLFKHRSRHAGSTLVGLAVHCAMRLMMLVVLVAFPCVLSGSVVVAQPASRPLDTLDTIPSPATPSAPSDFAVSNFAAFENATRSASLRALESMRNIELPSEQNRLPFTLAPFMPIPNETEYRNGFRYNHVDGVYIGIGGNERHALSRNRASRLSALYASAGAGYAIAAELLQGFVGFDYAVRSAPDAATLVGIETHRFTDTRDAWKIGSIANTFRSIVIGEDERVYALRTGWSAHVEQMIHPVFMRVAAEFRSDIYEQLPPHSLWSVFRGLFGRTPPKRENPPFLKSLVQSVIVAWNYESTPRAIAPSNAAPMPLVGEYQGDFQAYVRREGVRLHTLAEFGRGSNAAQPEFSFERYIVEAALYQPLGEVILLRSRFRLASVRGSAPEPLLFRLGGLGTLQGYQWRELSGNRMGLWNAELVWQTGVLGVSVIAFADVGWAHTADEVAPPTSQLFPAEWSDAKLAYGVGLASANGALRIALAWRADRSAPPRIVTRLGPLW